MTKRDIIIISYLINDLHNNINNQIIHCLLIKLEIKNNGYYH